MDTKQMTAEWMEAERMEAEQSVQAAIRRVCDIRWEPSPAQADRHVALLREYLQRAALWAEALGRTDLWPFFDVAAQATPERRVPPALLAPLEGHLTGLGLFGPIKRTCLWYVEWAGAQDAPGVTRFGLPAPYEPLIVMYEQGGEFSTEHGFFDLAGGGFPIGKWSQYRSPEMQSRL